MGPLRLRRLAGVEIMNLAAPTTYEPGDQEDVWGHRRRLLRMGCVFASVTQAGVTPAEAEVDPARGAGSYRRHWQTRSP
jgi:hypothetical protein